MVLKSLLCLKPGRTVGTEEEIIVGRVFGKHMSESVLDHPLVIQTAKEALIALVGMVLVVFALCNKFHYKSAN